MPQIRSASLEAPADEIATRRRAGGIVGRFTNRFPWREIVELYRIIDSPPARFRSERRSRHHPARRRMAA
jgi:hypothetical protein